MRAKSKDMLISSGIGIFGALVGILGTSYMNMYSNQQAKRQQLVVDSFTYSASNQGSKEYQDLVMLLNNVKTYSSMDANGIKELAKIARQYPNCARTLSEECKPMMFKMINVMRQQLNAGEVSEDDLKVILDPQYNKAIEAFRVLNLN